MSKRRQNIIIIIVGVAFLTFLAVTSTPPNRWIPTWHEDDRDAYGGYVTHQILESMFPDGGVNSEYRGMYELVELNDDFETEFGSILIITTSLDLDANDSHVLANYIEEGHTALLAANSFHGELFDSLDIDAGVLQFISDSALISINKRIGLKFRVDGFPKESFQVEAVGAPNHFSKSDTTAQTIAVNDAGEAIIRHHQIGEGHLYLVADPLLLSNYFVLDSTSAPFSAGIFSLLPPDKEVTHLEFYRMGRMEAQTPLRFFLSVPELKWAVYITMIAIILFMVFEAKRRQRIIPVVEPLRNTSIEFAETLGQLHYQSKGDHLNLASKRVNYLLEYIRSHYHMDTGLIDESFIKTLADKSGKQEKQIRMLMQVVKDVRAGFITENQFKILEILLNKFYGIESTSKTIV